MYKRRTHLVLTSTDVSTEGNPGIGAQTGLAQICPPAVVRKIIISDSDETLAWDIMPLEDN